MKQYDNDTYGNELMWWRMIYKNQTMTNNDLNAIEKAVKNEKERRERIRFDERSALLDKIRKSDLNGLTEEEAQLAIQQDYNGHFINKIQVIKMYRERTESPIQEAKEVVEGFLQWLR